MRQRREAERVEVYDTTLRDGAQGEGVSFSLVDKLRITQVLDALGVDYVEGGYPWSNPKDAEYFREVRKLKLRRTKVCAFGMTRKAGRKAEEDEGLKALVSSGADVVTVVGKSWDLHVREVLRTSLEENLEMIRTSVAFCRKAGYPVFFDAEHFFDGYRANRGYALASLRAALEGGASRLVLCDTNGGSLPEEVAVVVEEVRRWLEGQGAEGVGRLLGIHAHNDGGLGVANTLAAVRAGCRQVQGTINGIGERCGNADLTAVVPNLVLKMGYRCLEDGSLARLTETSRFVYEVANLNLWPGQPFVGPSAFAHKGGMHVHAVQRVSRSYEHIEPEKVGNTRRILISELSGSSNVAAVLGRKFEVAKDRALQRKLAQRVAELEHQGYQFEAAEASFELLLHEILGRRPEYWRLEQYRCVIYKRNGEALPSTEATVKLRVGGQVEHHVGEGDGPVNALDRAMRKCLEGHYPQLRQVHLRDYKVRVVNATAESAAKVRVVIEFAVLPEGSRIRKRQGLGRGEGAEVRRFATVGVSENIVDASWQALVDAFTYHLLESGVKPKGEGKDF